jgi:L-asparaginase II
VNAPGETDSHAVLAEVVRSGFVESVHAGSAIAVRGDGSTVVALGVPAQPVFPRSCLKPLQAVGMLRAGLDVDDEELAVICASHNGEDVHISVVRRILAGAGLDESALANAEAMPLGVEAARAHFLAGGGPDRIHQNCSGKHAGMLATCVGAGWPTEGYLDVTHPVQRAIRETVEELTGESAAAVGVDGCGAPVYAVSLHGIARAFARLVLSSEGTTERRAADAMRARPDLVGGSGRDVTTLMAAIPGLVVKDGAEGCAAAAIDGGASVAVKVGDGSGRARTPVLIALLRALGADRVPGADNSVLDSLATVPVFGGGRTVGEIRPAFGPGE